MADDWRRSFPDLASIEARRMNTFDYQLQDFENWAYENAKDQRFAEQVTNIIDGLYRNPFRKGMGDATSVPYVSGQDPSLDAAIASSDAMLAPAADPGAASTTSDALSAFINQTGSFFNNVVTGQQKTQQLQATAQAQAAIASSTGSQKTSSTMVFAGLVIAAVAIVGLSGRK